MKSVTIKTEEHHLDHDAPMLTTIKNEEKQELNASMLLLDHDNEQHYIPLQKAQSDEIALFPEGCRVLHSIQSDKDEHGLVVELACCFASVEAVAIYLPTRDCEYKTTSPLAKSRFVVKAELSFAPETPVWAVIAGASSTYTSAIVLSYDTTSKTYTVVDEATFDKFSNIAEKLVCYRAKQHSTPPPALQKELVGQLTTAATEGYSKQSFLEENRGTMGRHDDNNYELAHRNHAQFNGYQHHHDNHASRADPHSSCRAGPPFDFSTPRQSKFVGASMDDDDNPAYVTPPAGSNEDLIHLDSVDFNTSRTQPQEGQPCAPLQKPSFSGKRELTDDHTSVSRNIKSTREEASPKNYGGSLHVPKRVRADAQQQPQYILSQLLPSHHHTEKTSTCRLNIPSWAELSAVREKVISTSKCLRVVQYPNLHVSMSEGLLADLKSDDAPMFLDITEHPQSVKSCFDRFMVEVAKCCTEPRSQCRVMYDLAFANPRLSQIDQHAARIKIPSTNYKDTEWVGIIHVPIRNNQQMAEELGRMFVGNKGERLKAMTRRANCRFETNCQCRDPHIVVRARRLQDMRAGMQEANQKVMDVNRFLKRKYNTY